MGNLLLGSRRLKYTRVNDIAFLKVGEEMIRSVRIEREGRYEVYIPASRNNGPLLLARTHDFDHALYIHFCNQNSLLTDARI